MGEVDVKACESIISVQFFVSAHSVVSMKFIVFDASAATKKNISPCKIQKPIKLTLRRSNIRALKPDFETLPKKDKNIIRTNQEDKIPRKPETKAEDCLSIRPMSTVASEITEARDYV